MMEKVKIYKEANSYFDNGEYKIAFGLFLDLAKHDDVDGQNMLGYMYSEGYGVKKNKEKAKFWLRKSSKNGSCYADYRLACLYLEDNKIDKGLKLLEELSSRDYSDSIYLLAGYYYYGKYVKEDKDVAITLYEKATMLYHERAL